MCPTWWASLAMAACPWSMPSSAAARPPSCRSAMSSRPPTWPTPTSAWRASRLAVMTSIGPGAVNTAVGIATAYVDSSTMLVFTGDVHTYMFGRGVLQEVDRKAWADLTTLFEPITKRQWQVTRVDQLARILPQAYALAAGGRPGPVLISRAHGRPGGCGRRPRGPRGRAARATRARPPPPWPRSGPRWPMPNVPSSWPAEASFRAAPPPCSGASPSTLACRWWPPTRPRACCRRTTRSTAATRAPRARTRATPSAARPMSSWPSAAASPTRRPPPTCPG